MSWTRAALLLPLLAACALDAPEGPPQDGTCKDELRRPEGLLVAGSGSNLALVHAIARRFTEQGLGPAPFVAESIGTSGAVAALHDGQIDVGLSSRPLKEKERAEFTEVPLARVAMALVAHQPVRRDLAFEDVLSIFAGGLRTWPDGRHIVPLLREPGDSGNTIIARHFPALGPLLETDAREGRFIVAYTDQEMRDLLLAIEGSVGFLDVGTLQLEHLSLQQVSIDGKLPSDPGYPLVKPLSFLLPADPRPDARAFVDFATSPAIADILAEGGFLPPGDG
jgi:phosphate transport system substrate-binding protein